MPTLVRFALVFLFAAALSGAASAAPRVVATIKPLHSIAANVMAGIAEPELLLEAALSEHTAQLTPSQVEAMQNADLIVLVGETLEAFIHKALENPDIAGKKLFEASRLPGIVSLAVRDGGPWEAHHHEGEADGTHEAHGHDRESQDPHVWMDPENAKVIARSLATALSALDGANEARYRANAEAFAGRLDRLGQEIAAKIGPLRDRRYIVFHDAYQYFEARFGLNPAGSITVNPDVPPGARRIKEIHDRIAATGAVCAFAEPQFEARYVKTVIEGTKARSGVLDGLGAGEPKGVDAYAGMMHSFVMALTACLAG